MPHCYDGASADAAVLAASPVVLADIRRAAPHQQVLVNLGGAVPEGFERFERLIEVVSCEEDDRQQARRALEALRRPRLRDHAPRPGPGGAADVQPHRRRAIVPTLTEVVQGGAGARGHRPCGLSQEQLVQRVMQRVDLTLERRLREAIAGTRAGTDPVARALAARARSKSVVRETVSQALRRGAGASSATRADLAARAVERVIARSRSSRRT